MTQLLTEKELAIVEERFYRELETYPELRRVFADLRAARAERDDHLVLIVHLLDNCHKEDCANVEKASAALPLEAKP